MFAILHMSEKRGHAKGFAETLKILKTGLDLEIPDFSGGQEPKFDPVIEKYMDCLGFLNDESRLAERIVTFYNYINGIRIDLFKVRNPEYLGQHAKKGGLIEEDLALWKETLALGNEIIKKFKGNFSGKMVAVFYLLKD